ncbi:MAG: hypothetical protein LBU60_01265 [Clostridiales bacterium]|jgi:vacuolar-type H+-ATPase subunit E/Vma4|nr:hypothetical protein [Clostridiales bacterium]
MKLFSILDQLEYELSDKRGLFGKKVDIDKCFQLVSQLKDILPQVLTEAKHVMVKKDELLKNADKIAKGIINEAECKVTEMLDRAELTRKAELEGQKIIGEAYKKCDTIVQSTQQHLVNLLDQTEQYLQNVASNVKTSRTELNECMQK